MQMYTPRGWAKCLEVSKNPGKVNVQTWSTPVHHRHLHFTHRALDNRWFPKSLRFKAPSNHPVFKRIMERTSIHRAWEPESPSATNTLTEAHIDSTQTNSRVMAHCMHKRCRQQFETFTGTISVSHKQTLIILIAVTYSLHASIAVITSLCTPFCNCKPRISYHFHFHPPVEDCRLTVESSWNNKYFNQRTTIVSNI